MRPAVRSAEIAATQALHARPDVDLRRWQTASIVANAPCEKSVYASQRLRSKPGYTSGRHPRRKVNGTNWVDQRLWRKASAAVSKFYGYEIADAFPLRFRPKAARVRLPPLSLLPSVSER